MSRTTIAALCLLFLLAPMIAAEDKEEIFKQVMKDRETNKVAFEAAAQDATKKLQAAEAEYKKAVSRGFTVSQVKPLAEAIDKAKKANLRAKSLLDAADKWLPRISPKMATGDYGSFHKGPGFEAKFKVIQVISKSSALMQHGGTLYWVENDTTGLVDDKLVELPGIMLCTGPKVYNTAAGSTKTVMGLKYLGVP